MIRVQISMKVIRNPIITSEKIRSYCIASTYVEELVQYTAAAKLRTVTF